MRSNESYRFTKRLAQVEEELKQVEQKRARLVEERRELLEKGHISDSKFWSDPVFEVIEKHPGASRTLILSELLASDRWCITSNELTNCLTTLRRNGLIENRGTKKFPRWHITESSQSSREKHVA